MNPTDGKKERLVFPGRQAVRKIMPSVECGVPMVEVHRFTFPAGGDEEQHVREGLSGRVTVTEPEEKHKRRDFRFLGTHKKTARRRKNRTLW